MDYLKLFDDLTPGDMVRVRWLMGMYERDTRGYFTRSGLPELRAWRQVVDGETGATGSTFCRVILSVSPVSGLRGGL